MLDALTIAFDSYVSRKVFAYKVCVGVDESRQQRKRGIVDNLRAAVEGIENVCSLAHGQDFAADREGAHRRMPLRHRVDRACANHDVGGL